jgi:hypothetical protein
MLSCETYRELGRTILTSDGGIVDRLTNQHPVRVHLETGGSTRG